MKVERADIIQAIREANVVSDANSLRNDVQLVDQGLDSLGFLNVLLILGEKHNIEVPDEDIDRLTTIDAIVAYMNERLA